MSSWDFLHFSLLTNTVCCLSCRCSSCNLKKSVSRKIKHLTAKLCPRCSLTPQSNFYTPPPPNTDMKKTMVHRLSEPLVNMSKRLLAIAHTHYSVTCPRRRVILLSRPPFNRIPYPVYSVICKDCFGCWEKPGCYVFGHICAVVGCSARRCVCTWGWGWGGMKAKGRVILPCLDPTICHPFPTVIELSLSSDANGVYTC